MGIKNDFYKTKRFEWFFWKIKKMEKEFIVIEFPLSICEKGNLFMSSLKFKNIIKMYHEVKKVNTYIIIFDNEKEIERFEKTYTLFFGEDYTFLYYKYKNFSSMFDILKSEGNVILN